MKDAIHLLSYDIGTTGAKTCQMQALVLVDKAGRAVRNPMGYMDGWSKSLCNRFNVNPDHLPRVQEATDRSGELCARRQRIWGLQRELRSLAGEGTSR